MNAGASQTDQSGFDDDFIDIGRLIQVVWRRKWAIVALAFAISLATGMYMLTLQPIYSANASIELLPGESNVVNVEQVYAVDTYDYNYAQTQYEILESRNLAERVVRRLQLHKQPEDEAQQAHESADSWWDFDLSFDLSSLLPARNKTPPVQLTPEQQEEREIQSWAGWISGGVSVSPVEYSYIIYLSFESTDPGEAALIINTLSEEFIAGDLENRLSGTLDATGFLATRLEELKLALHEAELALQDFREREGLVDIAGTTGMGSAELRSLSQRLEDARKHRIEAQNIKEDVQGLANVSVADLMTIPAVLQHAGISDRKNEELRAERRVSELGKRYGPKHPKMIAAVSELDSARNSIIQEVDKVVSGIGREYEIALRNEQEVQATWEARKAEMQAFNRTEFQLMELQREVDANRQLYDVFFTRIKDVSETGGFERPHARIVDKALVPSSPVRPNKRLSVSLALVLGLMLGCGIALLLDMLDNTIKTPDDIAEKLGGVALGLLPKMALDEQGHFTQFWEDAASHYAEAVRTIRTGVLLSSLDEPAKVIIVTSTVPGEGKSTIALNLGAALGQMENTLVIDADLRRSVLANKCGLGANHQGLSHFVSGAADLDDCIEALPHMNISLMPAGVIPSNPLEMLSSKKFVEALAVLRERYDRIVIDSAPVQAVSDAMVLGSYADALIYVVRADATSASLAKKGIAALRSSNEPMAGVVLNQFDDKGATRYGAGSYYGYGSTYEHDSAGSNADATAPEKAPA